jgi:hypothetical protein
MIKIDKSWIARDIKLGAIYLNANDMREIRALAIVPCQGVWFEYADGTGYGDTLPFDEVLYAKLDEVEDYLADSLAVA